MDTTLNQPYIFLATVYTGLLIGLLYDIYKALRMMMKYKKWITIISDCLFTISALVVVAGVLYIVNSGTLRLYMFIGLLLGFLLYIVGISPLLSFLANKVLRFLAKDKCKHNT